VSLFFSKHRDLELHFSGASSPAGDLRLFRHLKDCESCREQYRTLSLLEALVPEGEGAARQRMARGLFTPAAPSRRALASTGFAVAFACVALVFTVGRTPAPFRARGRAEAFEPPAASLAIYRVPREARPPGAGEKSAVRASIDDIQRAGSLVHSGESLAFSYVNPTEADSCCLMVFGRDAAGHVFWFWPAWENAADDPASVPISTSPQPVELGEAVRHPLQQGPLTVVGLFTPKPLHVHQVEAAIANGLEGLQAFEGRVWTQTLEVSP
jgi:hypothetical protein